MALLTVQILKRKQNKMTNLSDKAKMTIIQGNFSFLKDMLVSPHKQFMTLVQQGGLREQNEPKIVRQRSITKVPLYKRSIDKSEGLKQKYSGLNQKSGCLNQKFNVQAHQNRKKFSNFQVKRSKSMKKKVTLFRKQNFFPLVDHLTNHKSSEMVLQIFRKATEYKDKTRRQIQTEEKEKQNTFQMHKQKIRKMIIEGVINPDKPGSYTFQYDGNIIPVKFPQHNGNKKFVQIQGKEIEDTKNRLKNKSIKELKGKNKQNRKQIRNQYTDFSENIFEESNFLKNFQKLQIKRVNVVSKTSKFEKENQKSQKSLINQNKVFVRDSKILKNQLLDKITVQQFEQCSGNSQQKQRSSLRRRFKNRNSLENFL